MPPPITSARRDTLWSGHRIKGRQREHCAAGSIEISGNDVQYIHQPLTNSSELLSADTNPSITYGTIGCGKFSCERPQLCCVHSADRRNRLRAKFGYEPLQTLIAVEKRRNLR